MKRLACYFLALLVIPGFILSGCGKGTTTTITENNPSAINHPVVLATSPYNGQLGVGPAAVITVTFSVPMDLTTVSPATFSLSDQFGNPVAGAFSYNGTSVTFTPAAPLNINQTYTVSVLSFIKSKTGDAVKPLTWTFQTTNNPVPLQLSSHHVTDNGAFAWPGTTFSYDDISATGTNSGVTGDDNYGSIPIGFTFNFYGSSYTTAYVGTNGYITFGSGDSTYSNYPFPSADGHPRIAPFFDDLYVDGTARIYYQVKGTAPSRRLIVQWYRVRTFDGGSGSARGDFEAILYEGTNVIQFQYQDIGNFPLGHANGGSATVGLNAGNGVDDTLYSFDYAYIANGRAIVFYPAGFYGLTTLTPPNGAVGVNRNTAIYAFFNKPLNTTTIPGAFSLVQTAGSIPVPVLLATGAGGGNSVFFSIPGTLAASTNFTATLSTALGDIYGVHLAAPITWSFTTGL